MGEIGYNIIVSLAVSVSVFAALSLAVPRWLRHQARLGLAAYHRGDYRAAVEHVNRSMRFSSGRYQDYYLRAMAYKSLGNVDAAFVDFTAAIHLNPSHLESLAERAAISVSKGNMRAALADLDVVVAIDELFADALPTRGTVRIALGDRDSGCDDLIHARTLGIDGAEELLARYCPHRL